MEVGAIAEKYPRKALHPELFDVNQVDSWLVPAFRDAMGPWLETGNPSKIDVAALPDIRVDAPGVISFQCLEYDFCKQLLREVQHYTEESGFPQQAPNSMNRYGVVLNQIGMRPAFSIFFRRYIMGVGARLFGNASDRAESVGGVALGTDDWGGSTLADHHTFVVRYAPDRDRGLDMHVDECDLTFNFGLTDFDECLGGDLAFCGMFGETKYRKRHHRYQHEVGRCVVHSGKRRHSVTEVEAGERASLIVWTKSLLFRKTDEYNRKCGDLVMGRRPFPVENEPPDVVCLSLTHDRDYLSWSHLG